MITNLTDQTERLRDLKFVSGSEMIYIAVDQSLCSHLFWYKDKYNFDQPCTLHLSTAVFTCTYNAQNLQGTSSLFSIILISFHIY